MKVTARIHFTDSSETREVHDANEAIAFFRSLPWENEFEKAVSGEEQSSPHIVFEEQKLGAMTIFLISPGDYHIFLSKDGKQGEQYIPSNQELNPTGASTEDYIEDYFSGELESRLIMDELTENETDRLPSIVKYEFSLANNMAGVIPSVAISAVCSGLTIMFIKSFIREPDLSALFGLPFLIFSILPLLLIRNHFRHDKDRSIELDKTTQSITITNSKEKISFSKKDIKASRIFSGRTGFTYILLKLKRGKHYSITSFIASPNEIATTLNIRTENIDDLFPYVAKDSLS